MTGARRLADYPQAGHAMDDGTGRRELILPFGAGAYVLRYKIDGEDVVIIRAWHSREDRDGG
jgi:plasmid stabilization system protein ParE